MNIDEGRLRRAVTKALRRKSFMTLATASHAGRPHAAGVLFQGTATVLDRHDGDLRGLLDSGALKRSLEWR